VNIAFCQRCGLIFAPDEGASGEMVCEPCLARIRRGRRFRVAYDPSDAPLFHAVAQSSRPADGLRCTLGLPEHLN
jgi:hypothetical protein